MPTVVTWRKDLPAQATKAVSAEVRTNWQALENSLYGVNLVADPTFLIWAAGDSAVPSHYSATGSPTISRIGTGLADTNRKVGKYALKLVAGGTVGTVEQQLLTTSSYDDWFDGWQFALGCWVMASAGSAGRIGINDGVATTYSSYHSGGGAWEWLTVGRTVDAAATLAKVVMECAASQTVRYSGPTCVLGDVKPPDYRPAPVSYGALVFPQPGTQIAGTNKARYVFARPALVKATVLQIVTAPTGQALIVDVNHFDGSAQQSMYSTRPQIAAGANIGAANPDGTYRYRCFAGAETTRSDSEITVDLDQIGSGTAGVDLTVMVRCLQYLRPLETFLGSNE